MANVHFDIKRDDKLGQFAEISDEETLAALGEACKVRKTAVEHNAPRDVGKFVESLTSIVERDGGLIRAEVFSTDDEKKVAAIEDGLGIGHFPNLNELRDWADRKGVPVYLVGRSLARKGTAARHVFERAADQTDAEVDQVLLDQLPERIVTRL